MRGTFLGFEAAFLRKEIFENHESCAINVQKLMLNDLNDDLFL